MKATIRKQSTPDLQSQLESLLDTVWRCEAWERKHPMTVMSAKVRKQSRTS